MMYSLTDLGLYLLTSAAMFRCNERAVDPEPSNALAQFLDRQYGDERIEKRWPNMIVTQDS